MKAPSRVEHLTPAQQRARIRIAAVNAATALKRINEPLDADWYDAEYRYDQWRRWNGDD